MDDDDDAATATATAEPDDGYDDAVAENVDGWEVVTEPTLTSLLESVAAHYVCDAQSYPALAGADAAATQQFVVRHSALHFAKSAGALAGLSESVDHGNALDLQALRALVPKALVNALKLAEVAGMSATELATASLALLRTMNTHEHGKAA